MSEIIGKTYNPYGMASNGSGLLSGFEYGRKLNKERGLASGFANYVNAADDEQKKAALAQMAEADPNATMGLLKAEKTANGFGNTELGLMLDVKMHPDKYPKEVVDYVDSYSLVKTKDPYLRGRNEYEGQVGKQQAEAGQPYNGQSNSGYYVQPAQVAEPETVDVTEQVQVQPVKPVTAASLAADKKLAEKQAEYDATQAIDAQKGWVNVDGQKKALKGSEAEREWKEKNIQTLKNNEVVSRASNTVLSDIDAILRMAEEDPNSVSGIVAKISSNVPGTTAADVAARIDSIKGNIAVDSLLNIKKSGAGLGQVPQKQAEMLSGLLGNLSQNQSPKEFMDVLKRIRGIYSGIVDAADAENKEINSMIYDPNGTIEQPQDEVISFEEWMKQGR